VADKIREIDNLFTNFRKGVRQDFMSRAEAEERFLIGGRKPKWRRMLRALWRVKDA
jgi:hypothetical protein